MKTGRGLRLRVEDLPPRARAQVLAKVQPKQEKPETRNKFGAEKTVIDSIEFDSKKEAARYVVLRDERNAGLIRDLRLQQPLQVEINGVHAFTYLADFSYERPAEDGKWYRRFEDSKGYRRGEAYAHFRTKKAVVWAALGIHIEEV